MPSATGRKVKAFREHFNMSTGQCMMLMIQDGNEISRSTWGYWEHNEVPADRLEQIAALTVDPKQTHQWLTAKNAKNPPKDMQLLRPIPVLGDGELQRHQKKRRKKAARRIFTPMDRSNVLADWRRAQAGGEAFDTYCKKIGISNSVVRRWMDMTLPAANGAEVKGVIEAYVGTLPMPVPQRAMTETNLPQEVVPKSKPGPKGRNMPTVSQALIRADFLCPNCGHPVHIPNEEEG